MPAVSVIMPAYNVEPYIGDAIRSALAQTYTDFELIVVDDGSTDGTADVVRQLAREDHRIRLVQQANRGLAGARNSALRAARGDFFALLDSDDLWEPEFLAEQLAILEARARRRHRHRQRLVPGRREARTAGASLPRSASGARPGLDHRRRMVGVHHVGLPPPRVHDHRGVRRGRCAATRTTTSGCAPRSPGSPSTGTTGRSGTTASAPTACRRAMCGWSAASCYVYTKLRPAIAERPREMAILDRQIRRFEAEWLAAEARLAIEIADFEAAREHLGALHARRGGAALGARPLPGALGAGHADTHDPVQARRHARRARRTAPAALTIMKYSIVIATYNRAADLRDTLDSLAEPPARRRLGSRSSSTTTRPTTRARSSSGRGRRFPRRCAMLFEREQGRSPALNAGIRLAQGDIIVTTDDDVRVEARLAGPGGRRARAARMRLRRRPRAADLGRAAAGVAAQSRRQALGGDRAARLRPGADRIRRARAARA